MSRLAITKRYSLANVGEGWQDCYLIYRPASFADMQELWNIDPNISDDEAFTFQCDFVSKHIVSGKVLVVDEDGNTSEDSIKPGETQDFPKRVFNDIFRTITGAIDDPKESEPTKAQ